MGSILSDEFGLLNYQYSNEYYNFMRESAELDLANLWAQSQEFLESIEETDFTESVFFESDDSKKKKYEELNTAEGDFITRILRWIGSLIERFINWLTSSATNKENTNKITNAQKSAEEVNDKAGSNANETLRKAADEVSKSASREEQVVIKAAANGRIVSSDDFEGGKKYSFENMSYNDLKGIFSIFTVQHKKFADEVVVLLVEMSKDDLIDLVNDIEDVADAESIIVNIDKFIKKTNSSKKMTAAQLDRALRDMIRDLKKQSIIRVPIVFNSTGKKEIQVLAQRYHDFEKHINSLQNGISADAGEKERIRKTMLKLMKIVTGTSALCIQVLSTCARVADKYDKSIKKYLTTLEK